jgi:adenylate kinase
MRVVLMGPPGVGKGTQAKTLEERTGFPHISAGDILRHAVRIGTPVGRRVRPYVESGKLVPDDLMGDLIGERLAGEGGAKAFILDGFPRTLEQVAILDRILGRLGLEVDRVCILTAPEEEIVRRLSGRRTCPSCGAVYHLESRPPASPGVCDRCSSALVQRPDDSENVIRERLRVYARETLPVADAYRRRSLLQEVDGTGEPQAVLARLEGCLGKA